MGYKNFTLHTSVCERSARAVLGQSKMHRGTALTMDILKTAKESCLCEYDIKIQQNKQNCHMIDTWSDTPYPVLDVVLIFA
jgi:hypothetical protein